MIAKINDMYKARSGKDMNDLTSREFTAMLVLADAINRAKSTDGAAIRDALAATDLPGEQTIMPWRRVKFDESGQNNDSTPVLLQYRNGKYATIFPAEFAVTDVVWPMHK
jgi:branched-chain amino acid transport system substrate-binding protein